MQSAAASFSGAEEVLPVSSAKRKLLGGRGRIREQSNDRSTKFASLFTIARALPQEERKHYVIRVLFAGTRGCAE